MAEINIELKNFVNAQDGSLLIKRDGRWQVTTFDELNKANEKSIKKITDLELELEALKRNSKHFVVYAKSHFLVVFNSFKNKILSGEIDTTDEDLLNLDSKVISDEISVEEAITKHEYLLNTYTKLYLEKKETIEFPEV